MKDPIIECRELVEMLEKKDKIKKSDIDKIFQLLDVVDENINHTLDEIRQQRETYKTERMKLINEADNYFN